MRVASYPLRAAQEHVRHWRDEQLRDIATGARTTALGIRPCHCRRRWDCDACGEPFTCWNVWPFLWELMPGALRHKKICRRCYGQRLLEAIEATGGRIEPDCEPEARPCVSAPSPAPRLPIRPPPPPGPRFRHYRRR